jgi:hypothetical protein
VNQEVDPETSAFSARAPWPTPQVFDASNGGMGRPLRFKGNAPSEAGNTRNPDMAGSYRGDLKDYAALVASGSDATGFPAATEKTAPLSPEHSRWLMGFPKEWGNCAPTEMPSASRPPRPS